MTTEMPSASRKPQTVNLAGQRFVIVPEAEYLRLRTLERDTDPKLPEPEGSGNYPAIEALRVTLSRGIIRRRRSLGLTQVELARRAGIRPETLNRLEHGKHTPSVATLEKLERAFGEVELEQLQ